MVTPDARARWLIGATAQIELPDEQLGYVARIDTGARTTSIHAVDVVVEGAGADMHGDVGKPVRFRSVNQQGEAREFTTVISAVSQVSNSQGSELRYQVPLRLRWGAFERQVDVNLRDRSQMKYKLLIGRDWLRDAFVVDVQRG